MHFKMTLKNREIILIQKHVDLLVMSHVRLLAYVISLWQHKQETILNKYNKLKQIYVTIDQSRW